MTQPLSRARMLALTGCGLLGAAALPRPARAAGSGPTTFPFDSVDRQIRFLQPVGTVLTAKLLRAGTALDVTLTLADLV